MMPGDLISFKEVVSPDIRNELSKESINIWGDGQWEKMKLGEGLPIIEEWRLKDFVISKSLMIARHRSASDNRENLPHQIFSTERAQYFNDEH